MKHWEVIDDNLHNTGWSLCWVSAVNREGRTISRRRKPFRRSRRWDPNGVL